MKVAVSTTSALLTLLLCVPPALAQSSGKSDWSRVRGLPPASPVVVSVTAGGIGTYLIAFADEATLILVRPSVGKLSVQCERAIETVGPNWAGVLAGMVVVVDSVRITSALITENGVPTASVLQVPRSSVTEVRLPQRFLVPPALVKAATAGLLVGAAASGSSLRPPSPYYYQQFDPAYTPGVETWPLLTPGNRQPVPDDRHVVYVAPRGTRPTEAEMQRLLQSLAPLGAKR